MKGITLAIIISIIIGVILAMAGESQALAQPKSFSKKKQTEAIKTIQKALEGNAADSKTVYKGVLSLFKLKQPLEQYKTKYCGKLKIADTKGSLENLYYDTATYVALKCGAATNLSNDNLKAIVKKAVDTFKNKSNVKPSQLYYAARILLLHKKKLDAIIAQNKVPIRAVFNSLTKIQKNYSDNLLESSYIYEVSTILSKFIGGVKANSVFNELFNLTKQSAETASFITEKSTSLEGAAAFARAIVKLTATTRVKKVEPEVVNTLAFIILRKAATDNVDTIFEVVEGLSAINKNLIYVPVLMSEIKVDENSFGFDAVNVFGEAPTVKEIVVKQAYDARASRDGRELIVEDEQLTQDGRKFRFAFERDNNVKDYFAEEAKGMYVFELGVRTPEKKSVQYFTIKRMLKRSSEVSIASLTLSISEMSKANMRVEVARQPLQFPQKLDNLYVAPSQRLTASLEFTDRTELSQVFLRLAGEKQIVTLPMKRQMGTSVYEVIVIPDNNAVRALRTLAGVYNAEIFVGDVSLEKPIAWTLGDIEFDFDADATYTPHPETKFFSQSPEIKHKFNIPEVRAPKAISSVFVFIVAAPLVIFVFVALFIIKVNIARFPFGSPVGLVSNLLFQGGIAAMLYVNVMYFFSWKLGPVLKYLVIIGGATAIVGAFALGHLHRQK